MVEQRGQKQVEAFESVVHGHVERTDERTPLVEHFGRGVHVEKDARKANQIDERDLFDISFYFISLDKIDLRKIE